ncbi:uncharacterized protein LOC133300483 [Gastrolobium bilobum]|uniref:uncharacterized protein LOC133300483 n=1 Tax=Gastrolobium bilobum TaxID=150636 RepID=UPI002AB169AC|nr:uncharacterized protein LOC133300483 [Gastrolobium bilobum]
MADSDSDSSAVNINANAKANATDPTLTPSDPRSPFFMPTSDSPDGSIHKPAAIASDETHAWTLCNSMINNWIHNTIDPLLKPYIHYFSTAKALWDDLRERYSIQNAPKIYQLKSNLFQLRQQGMSVSNYYTKLRGAWDELDVARALPDCPHGSNCPVTQYITKEMANDRVYQFLLGLDNAMFGTIRTQLLNQPLLPSLNKAYSTLV